MNTKDAVYNFCLRMADNNLISGQRLTEWCSRGPILEEDLAMTNLALDLFGQAESFFDYAASLNGNVKSADDLAFLRSERQYYNNLLVEQPNGDFAVTMMKQFLFSAFQKLMYEALTESNDDTIKGISTKALKEAKYHFRHSSEWVIRLGKGTKESHERVQLAINELWRFTTDMFEMNATDEELISTGISANLETIYGKWNFVVGEILKEATLAIPDAAKIIKGGCNGMHTEHLGHILTEMQYLQRAYPGATW